jgi:hypothetical protein
MSHRSVLAEARRWTRALLILPALLAVTPALAHTGLEGKVVDSAGAPVAGAWVYSYNSNNHIVYGLTEADGTYDLHRQGRDPQPGS